MYCSNCGKEIAEESNFCKFCGYKMAIAEDSKGVRPPPLPTGPEEIEPEEIIPVEAETKTPYQPTSLFYIFYIITWLVVGFGVLDMVNELIASPQSARYAEPKKFVFFAFWIGFLTAMIAKKKGKSQFLWFFIGFWPILFVLYATDIILRLLLK
jgi:hypothetical protein